MTDPEELPGGYEELIGEMGYTTITAVDEDDYQGSSLLVLRDGTRYGVLTYGWGSCSGCDALQACNTRTDFDELREDLRRGITWFDGFTEMQAHVAGKDWTLDYVNNELAEKFVTAVAALEPEGVDS